MVVMGVPRFSPIYIISFDSGEIDKIEPADKSENDAKSTEVIKLVMEYREEGKFAEAIELLKTALGDNPKNFSLTLELAKSYEQNGDIDLAI